MRVLIVDDSPTARAQARLALEEAQAELKIALDVAEADGGVEALRVLASDGDFELLLVDLHMPDIHGLEVLSFWRSRRGSEGRAVVVSTDVSEHDRQKARAHGGVTFVDKPVSASALLAALAELGG